MADETQQTPVQPQTPSGTSPTGQSGEPNKANDSELMRADYTRKTQALADERKAFEKERADFDIQRQAHQRQYGKAGYYQQPAQPQPQTDSLVEQFGYDGAQAIRNSILVPFYQEQFSSRYAMEYEKGQMKYGEKWKQFDYVDPMTGQQRNKVMDNIVQGFTLEKAWNAENPVDISKIEQETRDKTYREIEEKKQATPASASTSQPRATGTGHATTVEEAFAQAEAYHMGK